MSNQDYFSCSVRVMADSMQYQTPSGYSSGSDTDDTEATVTDNNATTISLAEGIVKQQQMYIYSEKYEKWHECDLILRPPLLQLSEYEDTRLEIQERQLLHIHKRWFHGSISRREAKYILQDYNGGEGSFLVRTSESYRGKFAISFVHEDRVKHVVIETKPDPVTGVVYHITPKGPFFNSLNGLVEEAKNTCIIQNHAFDVILTKSPPKPDHSWLHTNIRSLSQAEHMMSKEPHTRDGSFLVYPTNNSPLSSYSLVYRSGGNIIHANIMNSQRSSHGFTLNGVTAPVLYKLIHYFMENPVYSDTFLQHTPQKDYTMSNSAIAIQDFVGDCNKNELSFHNGDLVTNISRRSFEWCVADHRGDKQKFFPTKYVRFLTKEELQYIRDVREFYQKSRPHNSDTVETHTLNLRTDYTVTFETDGSSSIINIEAQNDSRQSRTFKLSCNGGQDIEKWYHELERNQCVSKSSKPINSTIDGSISRRKCSSGRKKRASCIIS